MNKLVPITGFLGAAEILRLWLQLFVEFWKFLKYFWEIFCGNGFEIVPYEYLSALQIIF